MKDTDTEALWLSQDRTIVINIEFKSVDISYLKCGTCWLCVLSFYLVSSLDALSSPTSTVAPLLSAALVAVHIIYAFFDQWPLA